jgi:hypothetical protein
VVATPLARLGDPSAFDAKVSVAEFGLFGCDRTEVGFPAKRVLTFHTASSSSPGAVNFRSFSFIVG